MSNEALDRTLTTLYFSVIFMFSFLIDTIAVLFPLDAGFSLFIMGESGFNRSWCYSQKVRLLNSWHGVGWMHSHRQNVLSILMKHYWKQMRRHGYKIHFFFLFQPQVYIFLPGIQGTPSHCDNVMQTQKRCIVGDSGTPFSSSIRTPFPEPMLLFILKITLVEEEEEGKGGEEEGRGRRRKREGRMKKWGRGGKMRTRERCWWF